MDNVVSNAEYENAYRLYFPLIKSALKKYYYLLDEHDLSSAGMNALLRCMRKYSSTRKVKFTTLLVNYVNWECGVILKQRNKHKDQTVKELRAEIPSVHGIELVDIMADLSGLEENMVRDRFVSKMTLKEMAEKYNLSKETIRQRLLKMRKKLREIYSGAD